MAEIGIKLTAQDPIYRIRGVGAKEFVYAEVIDSLLVDDVAHGSVEIEVGRMEYSHPMDGILGIDLLTTLGAKIIFSNMTFQLSI